MLDEDGQRGRRTSRACSSLRRPWPGMLRTLYKRGRALRRDLLRASSAARRYFVGDAARQDEDGYFWVIGRVDDVINVSGHRLSTAEVESAIVSHPKVAEAAVIGAARRGHRPGDLRLRHARGRPRGRRRARRGDPRARRRADRQARPPEADHLGRRPAEDPLGQDHAPAAARHRRGPRARRRDDAARPRRDGAARGRSGSTRRAEPEARQVKRRELGPQPRARLGRLSAGRHRFGSSSRTRQVAPEKFRFATVAKPCSSSRSASSRCATRSPAGRSARLADPHAEAVDPVAAGANQDRALLADQPGAEPAALQRQPRLGEQVARLVPDEVARAARAPSAPAGVAALADRLHAAGAAPRLQVEHRDRRGRGRSPRPGRPAARSRPAARRAARR